MINLRRLKMLSAAAIVSLATTGCKLAVIVAEGGEVVTFDEACHEGTVCIREVNSKSDTRLFEAIPKAGWQFVKWNNGEGFLCGGLPYPYCDLDINFVEENDLIDSIIASSVTYYLMPVFAPITEIGAAVTMNGKAWAPMDSFHDFSWEEINAVCPATNGGRCLPGGKLVEIDMTGWTWASVDDVNALINSYAGSGPTLGPGPDSLPSTVVGASFSGAGFPTTEFRGGCSGCSSSYWKGWTSTASGVAGQVYLAEVYLASGKFGYLSGTATTSETAASSSRHSAWFYRTP